MRSTLTWMILAGVYFVAINPKTLVKKLSFDGCKNDSWRVTDITVKPRAGGLSVVADVASGNKSTGVIHQVKLTLTGCTEGLNCTNRTDMVVGDVRCGTNVTELDKEACDVAETLAEWHRETGGLKGNFTKANLEDACIHYDTKLVNRMAIGAINTKEMKKTNDTKSVDRLTIDAINTKETEKANDTKSTDQKPLGATNTNETDKTNDTAVTLLSGIVSKLNLTKFP